jgi:hypothetical protein
MSRLLSILPFAFYTIRFGFETRKIEFSNGIRRGPRGRPGRTVVESCVVSVRATPASPCQKAIKDLVAISRGSYQSRVSVEGQALRLAAFQLRCKTKPHLHLFLVYEYSINKNQRKRLNNLNLFHWAVDIWNPGWPQPRRGFVP